MPNNVTQPWRASLEIDTWRMWAKEGQGLVENLNEGEFCMFPHGISSWCETRYVKNLRQNDDERKLVRKPSSPHLRKAPGMAGK